MFNSTLFASLVLFTSLVFSAPVAQRAGTIHTGDITFFAPGLGACGQQNTDGDLMTAVSSKLFQDFKKRDNGPNGASICGRRIEVTTPDGKSVEVTVQDECQACGEFDLDLSPAAFNKLANPSSGRVSGITWKFI